MKNVCVVVCLSLLIGWSSGICRAAVPTPKPRPEIVVYLRDPIEKILDLQISEGLKRFLLAELYAQHGEYENALELLDDRISIEILGRQFAAGSPTEHQVLLDYLRQKIQQMQLATPKDVIRQEQLRHAGDAQYETALAYKELQKPEKAIQELLEVLSLYEQISYLEGQMLVRYELALLYSTLSQQKEAAHHAQEFISLFHNLPISTKYEAMQELLREK
jgi:tetratricopeptide (TPR) repeat protein